MKTKIVTATAAVIFGALSLTSCKKECDCDKDKKTTEETTTTDTTGVSSTSAGMDNSATVTTGKGGSASGRTGAGTKSGATRGGDKSTLSHPAKDGTDAENHDGDYYTRNDTARKPTGSIK